MRDVAIVSAVRTPVGRAKKGALVKTRMDDLGALVVKEAVRRVPGLDPKRIEDVLIGCAMPEGEQGMNVARMVSLLAGLPIEAGAATINRFCGSSMQAMMDAARAIAVGDGDVFVAGGIETMSNVPMGGFNVSLNERFLGAEPGMPQAYVPMGLTAENVAKKLGISREDQDRFAYESHMKAVAAIEAGRFRREILPVQASGPDGTFVFDTDECPRKDSTVEKLATLKPVFDTAGTVTAGNSSPLNDGAAATVLMAADLAAKEKMPILAIVRGMAVAGVEPEYMGLGPVPAVRKALQRAGKKLADVDWIELNEAFAAQSIGVLRQLQPDPKKVNPKGGAIAIGHPLGCSGARIMTTLLHDLADLGGKWGLGTMCIGGGQGIAMLVERP